MAREKKKPIHYVDNKLLLQHMIGYRESVLSWKEAGKEGKKPEIPAYVAGSIVKIANRLSTMPGFVGYPFKEDMIGDGIVNCVEYIDNFNPAKSSNPFSYFTQIIYFAFIRRIKKEQKNTSIKVKAFDNLILELELDGMSSELQGIQSTLSQKRDKTDA